jgi:hypothetical protein
MFPGPEHPICGGPVAIRRHGENVGREDRIRRRRSKESFVFLGWTIRRKRSIQRKPRWHFVQRWLSPKAMKKLRDRVQELTSERQGGKDVKRTIAELNPVLRGRGNYFRTGNAD